MKSNKKSIYFTLISIIIITLFTLNSSLSGLAAISNISSSNLYKAGSYTALSESNEELSTLNSKLHAKYCALIDGETGRLLYGKNYNEAAPMASTTKIMTCFIALSICDEAYTITTSKYAASMPDVQLNAKTGEQFTLHDLLYSLLLKSHNDSAVVIAENCAFYYICNTKPDFLSEYDLSFLENCVSDDSSVLATLSEAQSRILVSIFARLMNEQAAAWGCTNTYFITPNGLDSEDENGIHHTTAYDLALIMSKCIDNETFLKICQTKSYSFTDKSGKSSYSISNANAFLDMYDNIIAGKTGFTGNAGYCYICAYKTDGRTYIVALMACGWPSNKTYKWSDSRMLLNYARSNYYKKTVIEPYTLDKTVSVLNGESDSVGVGFNESYSCLLSDNDVVNVLYNVKNSVCAPVLTDENAGSIDIYINDALAHQIPIVYLNTVKKIEFRDILYSVLKRFSFVDK